MESRLNCVILDDEPLAIELMESYVKQTSFLNLIKGCSNAAELFDIVNQERVDLVFMDIQMPGVNGLELSKLLDNVMVIFATAHNEYAIDSYRVNAVDYLLKPISYVEFLNAANKAHELFKLRNFKETNSDKVFQNSGSIFIKSDYKLVQINLSDIIYIEGLKDYIKIYVDGETNPIVSLASMKSVEESLPKEMFMRVHRSYIVNMNKVTVIDRSRVVFGQIYIPISDTYKEAFNVYIESRILR